MGQESTGGAIVGAIVGLIVAWLLSALTTKYTYLGGNLFRFEKGMGCLASLLLYVVLGGLGAIAGAILVK